MISISLSSLSSELLASPLPSTLVRNAAASAASSSAAHNLADLVQLQSRSGLISVVQPTQAQEVQQLYREGHTVPQISSSLNLSAQAIDTYLHISQEGT
jgi:DNA-binding NarL/FixJ family response regulator